MQRKDKMRGFGSLNKVTKWSISAILAFAPLCRVDRLLHASSVGAPIPVVQIDLANCGFTKPEPSYKEHPHLSDLPLDQNIRLTLSGQTLAIYFSDWSMFGGFEMQAVFVDIDSGKCVGRHVWPISKRVGLNESADTQARIMATSAGFLVHAGTSLALYSPSLEPIASYPLGYGMPFSKRGEPRGWRVRVAPGGKVMHLQPLTSQRSETLWMDATTLKELEPQVHRSGVETVSENAIVTRWARGLAIDERNSGSRDLCSSAACKGFPEVLNNNEVLVLGDAGFTVISVNGEQLWQRAARQFWTKDSVIWNHSRSLTGDHFAIDVNSTGKASFDGSEVARGSKHSIFVYDRACRSKVLSVSVGAEDVPDSDIALNDSRLVALSRSSVNVYAIPATNCKVETDLSR